MTTAIQVEMMHKALTMVRKTGQYTPFSIRPAGEGGDVHCWVVYAFRRNGDEVSYAYDRLDVCTDLAAPYVRKS